MSVNLQGCKNPDALKIKDIRAFIKKHGYDIKGRTKAELCHKLIVAKSVKSRKAKHVSRKRAKLMKKSCMNETLKEVRAVLKAQELPLTARSKEKLCSMAVKFARKTKLRSRLARMSARCKHMTKAKTQKDLARLSFNGKPLNKSIKARSKPALCKKLKTITRRRKIM